MNNAEHATEHPQTPEPILELVDEWGQAFKILSDPTRFRLLLTLHYQGPAQMTMTELANECELRPATASAALRFMSNSGILTVERDGRQMFYSLVDERIHRLLHYVGAKQKMHREEK